LRALVRRLGLRQVVFTGRVPPAEISRFYADADVYVQTPRIDNMPLSVLEAFASGLPVVSTDVGGVAHILKGGVHGLLAPDNDDEAIAARVLTLLEKPAYARELAAAAYRSCCAYQWSVAREGWLAAYDAVIGPTQQLTPASAPSRETT
jgi:L-malate glycosyltransferase